MKKTKFFIFREGQTEEIYAMNAIEAFMQSILKNIHLTNAYLIDCITDEYDHTYSLKDIHYTLGILLKI